MTTGQVWHLQAKYVYKNNGWVEKYYLKGNTGHLSLWDPRAAAQDLLQRRMLWLGTGQATGGTPGNETQWNIGPRLDMATVSLTDNARDGWLVNMNGYNAQPPNIFSGPVNDRCSGPEFRFETAEGTWANRILRGCPDAWVTDELAAAGPMPLIPNGTTTNGVLSPFLQAPLLAYGPTVDPNTGLFPLVFTNQASLKALRATYLDAVVQYCGAINKYDANGFYLSDPSLWTLGTDQFFVRALFRQISDHRTGARSDRSRARAAKRI